MRVLVIGGTRFIGPRVGHRLVDMGHDVPVFHRRGPAARLPPLGAEPGRHGNYEAAVWRIKDGLPKMKDFPAGMGGSGETLPE